MNLKTLIPIRHFASDQEGFLTPRGKNSCEDLVANLKSKNLVNRRTVVLCSANRRSIHGLRSAQYMASLISTNISVRGYEELFSLEEVCNTEGAVKVICTHAEMSGAESMVVVTHLEMMRSLPELFGKNILKTDGFPTNDVHHGKGYIINCVKKTWEVICP